MIIVGTTIAPYILDKEREYWDRWFFNANEIKARTKEVFDHDVRYFAAIEVDARGLQPYHDAGFLDALKKIGGGFWTFSFNDGSTEYKTSNRVVRITMGQNIVSHYAMEMGAEHLCFLAADCGIPDDGINAMLEIKWPLCGLDVPTYGFTGGKRLKDKLGYDYPKHMDVQEHMNSAACLFMDRSIFTRIKFRTDRDAGMTDDPCFHHDALALGIPTYVRHDVRAFHYPECIGAIETRHSARTIHQ
jgi:hypothetical protein